MNEMQRVFDFRGNAVRTEVVDGEPMFCLSDVCKVLDIANARDCKSRLNQKGVVTADTPTAGGVQSMTYINEQNLYKVIFQSRKPEAEAFTDWVTGEVLPAIRKSGGYMVAKADETPEETLARALIIANDTMLRQKAQLEQQSAQIENQARRIEEMAPKAAFVDNFCVNTRGNILIRDFAKHINQAMNWRGFGEHALYKFLRDHGYVNLNRYPSQAALDNGILWVYEGTFQHNDGTMGLFHTPKITPKGQEYLFRKIRAKYNDCGRWW